MSGNFSRSVEGRQFFDSLGGENYNVHTNHPLIPNSQQYFVLNKYVSIHSEDRDLLKYPNSSEFEIELPEDITNVMSLKLTNWTFPANYNTFSLANGNVGLLFTITKPYNPAAFGIADDFNFKIYEALFLTQNEPYVISIEEGFYNPIQMATEVTNKLNYAVSKRISSYFSNKGWTTELNQFISTGGYTRFLVVYNSVSLKLWFGNRADGFTIINQLNTIANSILDGLCLSEYAHTPDSSNWGLSGYLGLSRCNTESVSSSSIGDIASYEQINGITVPRFYYGDVTPGDNGFWLLPYTDFSGSEVYWVEPFYKVNLMGEAYMYMEIEGQNCIDETKPFNVSKFTLTTNQTNGVVNSAFAKLAIPTTPLSQWFDRDAVPYKFYNPPAERIRRLKIRIRYHNGRIVNFGVFNYSFVLQFTIMLPQITRSSTSVVYPPPMGR